MDFDKESISEDFFSLGEEGGAGLGFQPKKIKYNSYWLIFVLMLCIKFQVPGSSGSLVSTKTEGVTDRKGT